MERKLRMFHLLLTNAERPHNWGLNIKVVYAIFIYKYRLHGKRNKERQYSYLGYG